jgi:hypothetical protein
LKIPGSLSETVQFVIAGEVSVEFDRALKNSNLTEARHVRPGDNFNSSKPGLMLSERRFQEFEEFLFRDRPAIGEWADGASEDGGISGTSLRGKRASPTERR